MSVVLNEQTDTVVLEVLDFEIECIFKGHAAEVLVSCRFCESEAYHCSRHWSSKRRSIDEQMASYPLCTVTCKDCGTVAWSIDDLVRVVPL